MHARYKIRLLVVDDDEDDRNTLAYVLKQHFTLDDISFAEDGTVLLDYLEKAGAFAQSDHQLPDLILLDINMPKMSGLEALKKIKGNRKLIHIPVIIFTTSAQREDVLLAYQSGASGFIIKPSNLAELGNIVKSVGEYWFRTVQLYR